MSYLITNDEEEENRLHFKSFDLKEIIVTSSTEKDKTWDFKFTFEVDWGSSSEEIPHKFYVSIFSGLFKFYKSKLVKNKTYYSDTISLTQDRVRLENNSARPIVAGSIEDLENFFISNIKLTSQPRVKKNSSVTAVSDEAEFFPNITSIDPRGSLSENTVGLKVPLEIAGVMVPHVSTGSVSFKDSKGKKYVTNVHSDSSFKFDTILVKDLVKGDKITFDIIYDPNVVIEKKVDTAAPVEKAKAKAKEKEKEEAKKNKVLVRPKIIEPEKAKNIDATRDTSIIDGVAGVNVQVVFEFPSNDIQKSLYIYMPDMITISHSVSRAKIPVTLLGETTLSGLGLGSKMVAGSIVKLFSREDRITKYIKAFVEARMELLNKKENIFNISSNVSFKEITEYMRDDIAPFNIHLISTSEYMLEGDPIKIDSIFGCTIINTGKVSSIENLITEETLSFMAKSVKYHADLSDPEISKRTVNGTTAGSTLLYSKSRS